MTREFQYTDYAHDRTETVTCEWCPKAEWWMGQTSDGQRVYFEDNGEVAL